MLSTLIALTLAGSAATATQPELLAGPIKMSVREIRAYNATLPSDHPNFIRCKKAEETGSLVKKKGMCRTNQEWTRIDNAGNREAREAVEGLQKGWSNGR